MARTTHEFAHVHDMDTLRKRVHKIKKNGHVGHMEAPLGAYGAKSEGAKLQDALQTALRIQSPNPGGPIAERNTHTREY